MRGKVLFSYMTHTNVENNQLKYHLRVIYSTTTIMGSTLNCNTVSLLRRAQESIIFSFLKLLLKPL